MFQRSPIYTPLECQYIRLIVSADFNHDNVLDLAVLCSLYSDSALTILLGYGDGSFEKLAETNISSSDTITAIVPNDIDNDHEIDIVLTGYYSGFINVLRGNGDGTCQPLVSVLVETFYSIRNIWIADFTNDHQLDFVVRTDYRNDITVVIIESRRNLTMTTPLLWNSQKRSSSLAIADFNQDGNMDIVCSTGEWRTIDIFYGCGNGSFKPY